MIKFEDVKVSHWTRLRKWLRLKLGLRRKVYYGNGIYVRDLSREEALKRISEMSEEDKRFNEESDLLLNAFCGEYDEEREDEWERGLHYGRDGLMIISKERNGS